MTANFRQHAADAGFPAQIQIADADLMPLLWQIQVSVETGASVTRALKIAAEDLESRSAKALAARLLENISNGIPLSIALGRTIRGCPKIVCAVTAMGESTGRLDLAIAVLCHMRDLHIRWWSSFDSWILTYPRLCAAFWGILFLGSFETYQVQTYEFDVEPRGPFFLRVAQNIAGWICEPHVWLLLGLIGFWYLLWRRRGGVGFCRLARDACRKLPWVGRMLDNRLAARSMRLLAFLLEAGRSPLAAAAAIAESADRRDVRNVFHAACGILRNGGALSQAFSTSGLLPERVIRTIATGEELGTLTETVAWLAESYETEVGRESVVAGAIFSAGMILAQISLMLALIMFGFDPAFLLFGA